MRIEREVKLDYSDVLFRPKRSAMLSRRNVVLERSYQFKNSKRHYTGIPIIASNMHGVGTYEMVLPLAKKNMFTCLVKEDDPAFLWDWLNNSPYKSDFVSNMAVSTGVTDIDKQRIDKILKMNRSLEYVCIDVANGYSEGFLDFVKRFREEYPKLTIMAGNVVTPDITEELILSGADIVKVGIGPGCFLPGTIVHTSEGEKPIEEIKIGDTVKTHTGKIKKVTDTLVYDNNKPIISVNGIKSTDNHEYYVLHKKYKDVVTDDNIHDYAEWIEAKDLSKEYFLLKHV